MNHFDDCLEFVANEERGTLDDGVDPLTHGGVTQRTYDGYRRSRHLTLRSVTRIDTVETRAVYRDFWTANRCGDMPIELAVRVFDLGVNASPLRAAVFLQRALGVDVDGIVGPVTLTAANALTPERLAVTCILFDAQRAAHYRRQRRKWAKWGGIWIGRMRRLDGWLEGRSDVNDRLRALSADTALSTAEMALLMRLAALLLDLAQELLPLAVEWVRRKLEAA